MSENKLPEGMGKKIVEALKKQSENEEIIVSEPVEEQTPQFQFDEPEVEEVRAEISEEFKPVLGDSDTYKTSISLDDYEKPEMTISLEDDDDDEEYEMPNNINVLKRLVNQLPTGVPKHTGAQIIRQTIEALGIPMRSVLQDAQRVQEALSSSIKDCIFTINEYKSNIKTLEKQAQNYQKQSAKLNEIVSLFTYSEKK